jgi:hypothetical protein
MKIKFKFKFKIKYKIILKKVVLINMNLKVILKYKIIKVKILKNLVSMVQYLLKNKEMISMKSYNKRRLIGIF